MQVTPSCLTPIIGWGPAGMAAVGNPGGPGDPRTKRLEAGLATAQAVAAEVQVQLEKKKLEYDEMRDRLLAKDSNQFSEIRKLRAKVAELQGQLLEQQADTRFKLDEALKASEAEAGRLARDNLLLREQLATMSTAVQGIMTQRLAKATSEQRAQEAIKGEADRKLQLQ
ncbi:kinesin-like protein, partial [Haematococcus lacustris]